MTGSILNKVLQGIERTGNRLPHPTLLFAWLCLGVVALSALLAALEMAAVHPVSGETVAVTSLFSGWGLRQIVSRAVDNFIGFAPVGTVIVAMLGIGVAEGSGLLRTLLQLMVRGARGPLMTFAVVVAGVLSSLAADAGYVVLVPLAGAVFAAAGRPAVVGMAAAFAGVSGGFSANFLLGPVDVILAGITTEALARDASLAREIGVASNYYFMAASVLFVGAIGTWVTERVAQPFYQRSFAGDHSAATSPEVGKALSSKERRALWWTLAAVLVFGALLLALSLPEGAPLRHVETGDLLRSPLMSGIVVVISAYFALAGSVYGFASGAFANGADWVESMEAAMRGLAAYLVLMFFAAQFVNYFAWSNIGPVLSIHGASALQSWGAPPTVLLLAFVALAAVMNVFVGSMSAKWALMAPIFVPMLALVGVPAEATQAAYRIGDGSTNIITPLMPYFPVVLAFMQRYQPDLKLGTLIALMLPYSMALLLLWSAALAAWLALGWPLGPGV